MTNKQPSEKPAPGSEIVLIQITAEAAHFLLQIVALHRAELVRQEHGLQAKPLGLNPSGETKIDDGFAKAFKLADELEIATKAELGLEPSAPSQA